MMDSKVALRLPAQRSLTLVALVLPALTACSLAPMQRPPDIAAVAPMETVEDTPVAVPPAQPPARRDPDPEAVAAPEHADPETSAGAVRHALELVGTPYRYGGNTPNGFDCSGLVQYSYARVGLQLPRNTRGQRTASRLVKRKEMRPGDLLFFELEGRRHVGLYVGDGEFVHAPRTGKLVSIARLAHPYWQPRLTGVRRPLSGARLPAQPTARRPLKEHRPGTEAAGQRPAGVTS